MEEPKKNLNTVLIILCLTSLSIISFLFYLLYLISKLLTPIGSVIIFLLLLFSTARLLIRLSVFPGSFWLWKRSIESHFCREMCLQLLQKVQDLRRCLEMILDKCEESERIEFIDQCIESTPYAKRMITTIIETYNIQKQSNNITIYGESLLNLLTVFQKSLSDCKIIAESKETDVWSFIDEAIEGKDWVGIVLEDYPSNGNANKALIACVDLENRLLESCGETGVLKKIHRWLFDSSLGTIDQMRLELESKYHCEQIWIDSHKARLDCMMVYNPESVDSPTILLCSPNAGLYEFAYYQSEWLDYYTASGINVFMWNYRGYGRSQGYPNPSILKKDAEVIVEYLKKSKKVRILGVHGESLGGSIAAHLARYTELDFLFVDRSFADIKQVVQTSFGKWASLIIRLVTRWEVDSSLDYLYVNCYKLLSSDPQDNMINDLASLKSGVAIKLIETRGLEIAEGIKPATLDINKYYHILSPTDTNIMLVSVSKLMEYVIKYIKNDLERSSGLIDITNTSHYQQIDKEIENADDEVITSLLHKVFGILDGVDSGGKTLTSMYMEKEKLLSIKLWIMVLDIWGTFYPIDPGEINSTRLKSLDKLQETIMDLKQMFSDNEYATNATVIDICKEIKNLEKSFSKILMYLKNQIIVTPKNLGDLSPGRDEFTTCRHHYEYEKAGYLIPLTCGHSGRFNNSELLLLETHLTRIGFIK